VTEKLYYDLAGWWPVISPPSEYAEEAKVYVEMIRSAVSVPVRRMLELGSGGGNNAQKIGHAAKSPIPKRGPLGPTPRCNSL